MLGFTRASRFNLPKQRRRMMAARLVAVALLAFALNLSAAQAERPIVDLHRLDSYFQLFAADSSDPWKAATVRLDTYSSATVAFSVYAVDPADVLTAGSNFSPRAIDSARRRPILSFNFTPPGGYQFASNEVDVPLGTREGFFVVEARRGDVGEQVWINRSRVGLISKETPSGFLFYGMDLGTGLPLARMRLQLVVNNSFVTALTDAQGLVRWNRSSRPVFALAQWGDSYAFLSLLPQAPFPATLVGVRTDSAVVHAGGVVRVAGFARTRSNGVLRAGSGVALVSLRDGARTIAARHVPIDEAGAFSTALTIPAGASAGDYTVLAQVGGAAGGATVHIDSNAGDLSLDVNAVCGSTCDFRQDVPLLVHASRGDVSVRVTVIRSPHVYLGYSPDVAPWATTEWLAETVRVDGSGNATVDVPRPLDDLGSTYGVHVESDGATADTRVVVPTAQAAIRLNVDRVEQSLGAPLTFDVYGETLEGKPLANASLTVELVHGRSTQQQQITLDGDGHARGSFTSPELGTNLIFASTDHGGRATDAAAVQIDPQASAPTADGRSPNVRVSVGASSYRTGEEIAVNAVAPGSQGDALITFESGLGLQFNVVGTSGGDATAKLRAANAAGELCVGAAFVRDGAIEWSTLPLALSAPGRPHLSSLSVRSEHFAPGEDARVAFEDGSEGRGTFVVRISRGTPSGSALFSSAPALLAIGLTTTQSSAPEAVTWHPSVDSTGNHAQILGFVRRTQPPPDESLPQAQTETVSWRVARGGADGIAVELPSQGGRYLLTALDISDDGSVSAGSSVVEVR
jgi:hypothetical protein